MLYRQMRYFVSIVENNSFTEAAAEMFVSQSAISQQMKVLENDMGVKLFIREKRSFTLTPAGEYFYTQARDILARVEDVCAKVREIGSEDIDESRLRVGYLSNYSGQELYQAVAKFSELYPDVPIDMTRGTHEELYHGMLDGSIDLAFNDQRRVFSDDFVNFQMLQCNCYIEISNRNSLSSAIEIDVDELKSTPCIIVSSKEQEATEIEYYRNIMGYDCAFICADSIEEARLMTVGNRGFFPIESVETLPPVNPTVTRIPVMRKGRPLKRNYCVFWPKERENYYIAEFGNLLHDIFKSTAK